MPKTKQLRKQLERMGNVAMALKATLGSTDLLRLERASLLARYDNGALSSAVFAVIKKLEVEIAWRQHAERHRLACERE